LFFVQTKKKNLLYLPNRWMRSEPGFKKKRSFWIFFISFIWSNGENSLYNFLILDSIRISKKKKEKKTQIIKEDEKLDRTIARRDE